MNVKLRSLLACTAVVTSSACMAATPYGSCPEPAQKYQDRYESTMRASDLVCYQKALEREMSGGTSDPCTLSADHYQTAYETGMRSSDLVCYQKALERELR